MDLSHNNSNKHFGSKNRKYILTEEDDQQQQYRQKDGSSISVLQSNQVFFYNDITSESMLLLNRQILETEKHLKCLQITYNLPEPPPIELFINSCGGEVFSAFSSVDIIKSSKIPVHTYIEGVAASAATLISVCAKRRFIRKHSFVLIHALRSGIWGTYYEIKDESANVDLLMKYIKNIYLEHTRIPEKQLNKLFKHDLYLDSEEALKLGIVDEIV